MHGGGCTAPTTTTHVAAANFASSASGVRRRIRAITASKSGGWLKTARLTCGASRFTALAQEITMTDYEFTLKFRLPDSNVDPEQFVDALSVAGCDDALVGIGQRGRHAPGFGPRAQPPHPPFSTPPFDSLP